MFFCEHCEIFKNTFFYRTPPLALSEDYKSNEREILNSSPRCSNNYIDNKINAFKKHRRKASIARQFYRKRIQRSKELYKNRSNRSGKQHLSLIVVGFDFAEDVQVPSHCDQ